jgi:hypothetical protein
MVSCGDVAFTIGEQPPAMSSSWSPPVGPGDAGFVVFFG